MTPTNRTSPISKKKMSAPIATTTNEQAISKTPILPILSKNPSREEKAGQN